LHGTILSTLLLIVIFDFNVHVHASNGGVASQNPGVPAREQRPQPLLVETRQTDHATLPVNSAKLIDGTPVRLRLVRAVVSSQVIAGEKLPLEVAEPVLVGNLVAILQHGHAEAIVTVAQAKRNMGRGGNLQLKIESIPLADGELVPTHAVKDVKGEGRQVILAGMVCTFLFDLKGKNASIPAGTEITVYISGDFPLDPSKFQTSGMSPQEKNAPK
jgi:hypothetical protein